MVSMEEEEARGCGGSVGIAGWRSRPTAILGGGHERDYVCFAGGVVEAGERADYERAGRLRLFSDSIGASGGKLILVSRLKNWI